MSELITVARPYARAGFELAREDDRFQPWSDMLAYMGAVARDPTLHAVLDSPRLSTDQVADLFISVCGEQIDEQGASLVRLMAENRRLAALPEVAALFEQYRASAEGKVEVELISAQELDPKHRDAIIAALKQRLGRDIDLSTRTDPSLLGGAIIRAGDLVIDGSIRGRLNRLAVTLSR
jgi:F-type H+-transporting ATPase subunit delta